MPIGKAPGKDGIPPELIKIAVGPLADHLLDLLQCWIEGKVPQDMKDSVIVTIYKNKMIQTASHSRKCTVVLEASSDLTDPVVPLSTNSCPYCRITFSSQYDLYSHLRTHHLHSVDWSCNGVLQCEGLRDLFGSHREYLLLSLSCRTLFQSQAGLYSHLHTHHQHYVVVEIIFNKLKKQNKINKLIDVKP